RSGEYRTRIHWTALRRCGLRTGVRGRAARDRSGAERTPPLPAALRGADAARGAGGRTGARRRWPGHGGSGARAGGRGSCLHVVATAFRGAGPPVPGLEPTDRFAGCFERKLFTHNLGHAVAAYLGHTAGLAHIHEAMADAGIAAQVRGAMEEAGAGLVVRWGFSLQEQAAHAEGLMGRFANAALRDTVTRVGRDPLRKLRSDDRLVGGALLALEHGVEPRNIAAGIAAALRFDAPGDPSGGELQRRLAGRGVGGVPR